MRNTIDKPDIFLGMVKVSEMLERRLEQKGDHCFASVHETLGIITEEYWELIEAVKSDNAKKVEDELIDLAVGAIIGIIGMSKKASKSLTKGE